MCGFSPPLTRPTRDSSRSCDARQMFAPPRLSRMRNTRLGLTAARAGQGHATGNATRRCAKTTRTIVANRFAHRRSAMQRTRPQRWANSAPQPPLYKATQLQPERSSIGSESPAYRTAASPCRSILLRLHVFAVVDLVPTNVVGSGNAILDFHVRNKTLLREAPDRPAPAHRVSKSWTMLRAKLG